MARNDAGPLVHLPIRPAHPQRHHLGVRHREPPTMWEVASTVLGVDYRRRRRSGSTTIRERLYAFAKRWRVPTRDLKRRRCTNAALLHEIEWRLHQRMRDTAIDRSAKYLVVREVQGPCGFCSESYRMTNSPCQPLA